MNGGVVSADQAMVSVYDHGFLYGDGVFEGVRWYQGRLFRLPAHLTRLRHSAAVLRIDIPYTDEQFETAAVSLVAHSGVSDGYVRIIVTRGIGKLGIDPRGCERPSVILLADQIAIVDDHARRLGARVIIAATRRLGPDGLDPRIKSLNYVNHILAKWEAINAGADEAIMLNAQGFVSEGSADNIFVVKQGVLLTPPVTDGALEGITRAEVMSLAAQAGIPCRESRLSPYDLYTSDECFLTGTAAELIPVREIDGRRLNNIGGPVFSELEHRFSRVTRGGN